MDIPTSNANKSTLVKDVFKSVRIDYVDYLKAFSIFGVVWIHSVSCPNWLTPMLVDIIFFFLSGIFFKRSSFKTFLLKKVNRILIPFFIFYFLYYPYRMIWHYWDFRTMSNFEWQRISDFLLGGDITTLPGLWFLFSLFLIQVFFYFLSYLDKRIIAILSILILFYIKPIFLLHWPYLISTSICCFSYFALGNLFGQQLLILLNSNKNKIRAIIVCILLFFSFYEIQDGTLGDQKRLLVDQLTAFVACVFSLSVLSFIKKNSKLSVLLFFGKNTLAMLCIHVSVLRFFTRFFNKILEKPTPLIGFISTLATFVIGYFIIKFLNNKMPYLVGKVDLIK